MGHLRTKGSGVSEVMSCKEVGDQVACRPFPTLWMHEFEAGVCFVESNHGSIWVKDWTLGPACGDDLLRLQRLAPLINELLGMVCPHESSLGVWKIHPPNFRIMGGEGAGQEAQSLPSWPYASATLALR